MKKMQHIPVLASDVIDVLRPGIGERFVDFTVGYGGHAKRLLEAVGKSGYGYLFDQDDQAIAYLQEKFRGVNNVSIEQANFGELDWENDIPTVDMMLADLGVSSPQLDQPERGFSFQTDGPLDMRMDTTKSLSAADIVNIYREPELADLIYRYGEERRSRQIAKAIVTTRADKPIQTTTELADIVRSVVRKSPKSKIDPATRTFQALRIAVNDELGALESLLEHFTSKLAPGGRLAIISFHSLEDRMVKRAFKKLTAPKLNNFGQVASTPEYKLVTKKPIMANESDKNPRARTGKLRAVEKIK